MKGGIMSGITIILTFIGLLVIPAAVFKLWYWFWFFFTVGLVLIAFEIIAVVKTGKTISQQFQSYYETNKGKALILAGCWLSFFMYLIILHLILGF